MPHNYSKMAFPAAACPYAHPWLCPEGEFLLVAIFVCVADGAQCAIVITKIDVTACFLEEKMMR